MSAEADQVRSRRALALLGAVTYARELAAAQGRRVRHGLRRPANWFQLMRFSLIGALGYVINLAVYSTLVVVGGIHYVPAAILAFCVAVTNNFLLNRHWTFNAGDERITMQAPRFLAVSLIALGFNLLVLELLVGVIGVQKIAGQAIAVLAATPLSFIGNKLWSFRGLARSSSHRVSMAERRSTVTLSSRELLVLGALATLLATAVLLAVGSASTARSFAIDNGKHGVPAWVVGPLVSLGQTMTAARFILLMGAMWVAYLIVVFCADSLRTRWVIGTILALNAIFFLAPPLLSTDVFNYIDYGRLAVFHHLNPYAHGPAAAAHDPLYSLVGWRHTPSIYGPLFTLGTYPITLLGLAGSLWTFKAITVAASLACVALLWRSSRKLGLSPLPGVALLGLNPILLVYGVAGAHNDLLVLMCVLLAITLTLERREALAGFSLVAGLAIKATAAPLLPFMALGVRHRRRVLFGMLLSGAMLGAVAIGVFGGHAFAFFHLAARHQSLYLDESVPPHLAVLLGLDPRASYVRVVAEALALIAVAILLVRTWRGANWIAAAGWATVSLLLATTWLLPWYTIWALPMAALGKDRRLLYAALALGTFVIASRLYFLKL